jgi:hypothetical protein
MYIYCTIQLPVRVETREAGTATTQTSTPRPLAAVRGMHDTARLATTSCRRYQHYSIAAVVLHLHLGNPTFLLREETRVSGNSVRRCNSLLRCVLFSLLCWQQHSRHWLTPSRDAHHLCYKLYCSAATLGSSTDRSSAKKATRAVSLSTPSALSSTFLFWAWGGGLASSLSTRCLISCR